MESRKRQTMMPETAVELIAEEEPGSPSRRWGRSHTIIHAEVMSKRWTVNDANESMGTFAFIVNMFADLCPPGMLPLAYGLKQTGIVPGLIMLVVFYLLCAYTMSLIGRTAQITGENTFAGQWAKTIGEKTSWVPVAVVACVCFGTLLSYGCFYADILERALPSLGIELSRTACVIIFGIVPTLPLCLLKDLAMLSYSSAVAVVAVLYTAVVMAVRSLDGSYAAGGQFLADVPAELKPDLPAGGHVWDFGVGSLVLVNTLAMAFISHYNGCKYYRELIGHTPTKLQHNTFVGMGISAVVFACVMTSGYYTFGSNADGVILKNYSRNDPLINGARLGMAFSIIASFPLMFSGLRESIITLLQRNFPLTDWNKFWRQDALSAAMLSVILGITCFLTDAGLVVGVVGALCGSTIIYIVPALLYASAVTAYMDTEKHATELTVMRFLGVWGACLACAGTAVSLVPTLTAGPTGGPAVAALA